MATFNKFNCFVEDVCEKQHNFSSDSIRVALFAAADQPLAADTTLANVGTQITTNVAYLSDDATDGSLKLISSSQSGGVYKAVFYDITITATGGAIAEFQHIVIYNHTATKLIGWYSYPTALTLLTGESLTVDLNQTDGLFSVT